MHFPITRQLVILGITISASCIPYDEGRNQRGAYSRVSPPVTPTQQASIEAQKKAMKEKEDRAVQEINSAITPASPTSNEPPQSTSPNIPTENPKPAEVKKPEYKYATKIPGKDGFVLSPYNNKMIDVRDMPSGTLVQDPTYTGAGKGYFRVP